MLEKKFVYMKDQQSSVGRYENYVCLCVYNATLWDFFLILLTEMPPLCTLYTLK